MRQDQIQEQLIELKTEMKYISKTLSKVEKVLENQNVMLERINHSDEKIKKVEKKQEGQDKRIEKLERWQIQAITLASVIATIGSTIIGFGLKYILGKL